MKSVQAFVAMPFNPIFLPVWKTIRRACEKNNIVPVRVDQLPLIDDIHKTIFSEIEHSDIIIVDFSGDKVLSVPNPNVVTEATHAKGLRKPIIILTQSTDALPFDWRTHRAVVYENNQEGLDYLAEVLEENLGGIKSRLSGEVKVREKQSERYKVFPSGIIQDTKTGLEWLVGLDKDVSWNEAKAWVDSIDSKKYGIGWRMPVMKELRTIYDPGKSMCMCNIDSIFVVNQNRLWVWTGVLTSSSGGAWCFNFHNGCDSWFYTDYRKDRRCFAVRSEV